MSEQEIRAGQRWRRKCDGVEVEVVEYHYHDGWDNVEWRRAGSKRAGRCCGYYFRTRYNLIEADQ